MGPPIWAEGHPVWGGFFLSGLVPPVWAEASSLSWVLLFPLVASCLLGGGAFHLAEEPPVWSEGLLIELGLPSGLMPPI